MRIFRFDSYFGLIAVAAGPALFLGCGESKPYNLAPVSGVVTLDGKPVALAEISFQPLSDAENPGPGSAAHADDAGHFELKTIHDEPGAVIGKHTVRIYSHKAQAVGDSDAGGPQREIIPRRYNFDSTLTFDVTADGTDAADFQLTTP